jgi:hypothetical protein
LKPFAREGTLGAHSVGVFMRATVVVVAVSLVGCGSCAEKVAQAGVEKATGVKVDVNGEKAVYTGKDGTRVESGQDGLSSLAPTVRSSRWAATRNCRTTCPSRPPPTRRSP